MTLGMDTARSTSLSTAHRMACAKCDYYVPKKSTQAQLVNCPAASCGVSTALVPDARWRMLIRQRESGNHSQQAAGTNPIEIRRESQSPTGEAGNSPY